jgi:hypothetical protein
MLLLLEYQIKMIKCEKCSKRMFVDRQYSNIDHLETYCICCGSRTFYHPPSSSKEGKWLLQVEILRAKRIIAAM